MHLQNRTLVGDGLGKLKIDLRAYREKQGLTNTQVIHAVTQVDACAMASNPKFGHNNELINIEIIKKKDGTKVVKPLVYAYAFYMVPLDSKYKPELLYMLLSSQGIGNKKVIPTYEKIKEIVEQQGFILDALISDGDASYVKRFSEDRVNDIINHYTDFRKRSKYDRIPQCFLRGSRGCRKITWIRDLIHVSKNLRARGLAQKLSLCP
ncbi:Conserved_hypothetical protein [Hexamita inflata]|uniref:Uncharacterized protein n=1 Tax=Hexamita inflata TaxID=28002 RepID=A0AA86PET5_9EUKA|nr:Conserved hypothetical protein [Hexamita inflata]